MSVSEGTKQLDDLVVRQIQTKRNSRMLGRMPSFRVEQDTPDGMMDLLRQMERSESRATGAQKAG